MAVATQDRWVRQPSARWITEMVDELGPRQRRILARRYRSLQTSLLPEDDFFGRWGETADFATTVVHLWFEGRTLEDVLERAKALGQMDGDLPSGRLLEGPFIDELGLARDITFDELLPMVRTMNGDRKHVSVYKVRRDNCFDLEHARMQPVSKLRPRDGQGSLNTTWTYGEGSGSRCGLGLMDGFHDSMAEALEGCGAVTLNPRLYMIWKFPHYATSCHQDTHVPPHITIYNQVSGYSLFHFLPLLVGLYVSHIGRADVSKLESMLRELDVAGIGSLCTLGPGQVAMITPFGSHGVWVPAPSHNPSLTPFSVSVIRAAEIFVAPLLEESRKRHCGERWNEVRPELPEGLSELKQFAAVQMGLCREMELSRQDWLALVRRTWAGWEAEAACLDWGGDKGDEDDSEDDEEDYDDDDDDEDMDNGAKCADGGEAQETSGASA
uniref:Uncharacterized protein n=1 Tax=Alexandrium catenella TaxID=2925 RepID=A0A7S1M700_ALECA